MSFSPLYKIQRAIPAPDEKLLLLDKKGRVYLQSDDNGNLTIPHAGTFPELLQVELPQLGVFRNRTCYGCRCEADTFSCDELLVIDVREAVSKVDNATKNLLLRGKPILEWLSLRKYCSACGAELFDHEHEEARTCPNCGMLFFPKISPAVIVMIKREDGRILLAYNRNFRHKAEPAVFVIEGVFRLQPVQNTAHRRQTVAVIPPGHFRAADGIVIDLHRQ